MRPAACRRLDRNAERSGRVLFGIVRMHGDRVASRPGLARKIDRFLRPHVFAAVGGGVAIQPAFGFQHEISDVQV